MILIIFYSLFDYKCPGIFPQASNKVRKLGGEASVYHSQHYRNGSKCDLTNQPRRAEVRVGDLDLSIMYLCYFFEQWSVELTSVKICNVVRLYVD